MLISKFEPPPNQGAPPFVLLAGHYPSFKVLSFPGETVYWAYSNRESLHILVQSSAYHVPV
jgi:hypothetical protein